MINRTHESLGSAYILGLKDLLTSGDHVPSVTDPTSPASAFGAADRPAIELLGYSFEVSNPSSSLFLSKERPLRLQYCIGQFLWSIAGSDSVAWLSYYHPAAPRFSDDGLRLCGAFGKRLFNYKDKINQIRAICTRISEDPGTRRALGMVSTPEDNISGTREYPCCIGVQYFLRGDKLHAITYMRAQQALTVLPFDAFLFMALQCFLADRLGVEVGPYRHIAGTYHIYEAEVAQAEDVISAGTTPIQMGDMRCSKTSMPELLRFEQQLRQAVNCKDTATVESLSASYQVEAESFYEVAKATLMANGWLHLNQPMRAEAEANYLNPPLRELFHYYVQGEQ